MQNDIFEIFSLMYIHIAIGQWNFDKGVLLRDICD